MKSATCYITLDGVKHDSQSGATRHAEKLYGDQLSRMAHELIKIEKYSDMVDKLDGFAGSMRRLLELKADIRLDCGESYGFNSED